MDARHGAARSRRSSRRSGASSTRLQEDALFTGEYDARRRRRLRSTRARAARTPRTGPRCCCACTCAGPSDRGFQTELIEASPGEEAGLKSATVTVKGENAYGIAEGRARRPPARAPVAVRQRPPPAHGVRAGGRRAAPARRERRRDRRGRPPHRHLPRERRGRPAREQDRFGRSDHPPADGDRRPVPERALADLEQADGAADPQSRLAELPGGGARGGAGEGARRGAGHRLRESNPQLRAPPVPAREGPPHRPTRSATPRACSTATSTGSSARTCSRRPPGRSSSRSSARLTGRSSGHRDRRGSVARDLPRSRCRTSSCRQTRPHTAARRARAAFRPSLGRRRDRPPRARGR